MKKIFTMLLVLFIIYIGIQVGFRFFGQGHEYEYQIQTAENKFLVKEIYTNNTKNELDNYYFEIGINGKIFNYQTLENFNKQDHIIKDIYYFENNNISCILPIFLENNILVDIMCLKNDTIYYYNDLVGKYSDLDNFASGLSEVGYDKNNWQDRSSSESEYSVEINKANVLPDKYLGLANYKGIYTINNITGSKIKDIQLFDSDVYKRPISVIFNQYYVVADYNQNYRFTKFIVVNLTNNKTKEIDCEREISFDSYIQGTDDNSIYLFDKDSGKQYEINLKTDKVLEVGNENIGIKIYRNGDWDKVTIAEAKNNEIIFDNQYKSDLTSNEFVKIDKVGGDKSGYYYFYQKNRSDYSVYRSNVQNSDILTYLFNTTDIHRIVYDKNYVYYVYNEKINYFNEKNGVRTLLKNSEISFNKNLIFGLYSK